MSLESFTNGEEESEEDNTNKREFDRFTREEFEECLAETSLEFEEVQIEGTKELVYASPTPDEKFACMVWSSLDRRTGEARDKGSDAIRVVVKHIDSGQPVLKEKRTNRIQTWCKNLKKKIENVKSRQDEIEFCDECGSLMVIRENSDNGNKFYGCLSYPDCKYTKPVS